MRALPSKMGAVMSDERKLHLVGKYPAQSLEPLVRKLESIGTVGEAERRALLALPAIFKSLGAYEDIVRHGDKPSNVTITLDGLACRYDYLENGGRQIMAFHVPGDMPDVTSLFVNRMDHHIGTLTEMTIASIAHAAMFRLFDEHPRLAHLFWRGTLIEAAIFRQWIINLGRRDAYARMAHLLCEIMTQMQAAGVADEDACQLPLTQAELADAMGTSTVHVNRTLQALRAEKLIELRAGWLKILDWERLKRVGEFDPEYLHLKVSAA
jgi:CRP-like cAMP-binding protein